MRRSPLLLGLAFVLCSALGFAAPPTVHEELAASTKALVLQTAVVKSLADQHDAQATAKAALDARVAALTKELGATSDLKRRAVLQQQIDANNALSGSIFAFMIEYQKMLNKEAREDKKIARETRELADRAKLVKVDSQNVQVRAQMKESQDKADAAMTAADAQLVVGVVAAALSIGATTPPRVGAAASLPQGGGVPPRLGGNVVDAGAR
jgi:hypothetical protein